MPEEILKAKLQSYTVLHVKILVCRSIITSVLFQVHIQTLENIEQQTIDYATTERQTVAVNYGSLTVTAEGMRTYTYKRRNSSNSLYCFQFLDKKLCDIC